MKDNCSKTLLMFLPIKMHIVRQKLILLARVQKKMSLKSDQLELDGSVYHFHKQRNSAIGVIR